MVGERSTGNALGGSRSKRCCDFKRSETFQECDHVLQIEYMFMFSDAPQGLRSSEQL